MQLFQTLCNCLAMQMCPELLLLPSLDKHLHAQVRYGTLNLAAISISGFDLWLRCSYCRGICKFDLLQKKLTSALRCLAMQARKKS